jgi:hypothetical protein
VSHRPVVSSFGGDDPLQRNQTFSSNDVVLLANENGIQSTGLMRKTGVDQMVRPMRIRELMM